MLEIHLNWVLGHIWNFFFTLIIGLYDPNTPNMSNASSSGYKSPTSRQNSNISPSVVSYCLPSPISPVNPSLIPYYHQVGELLFLE